jgi:hypothetical protein
MALSDVMALSGNDVLCRLIRDSRWFAGQGGPPLTIESVNVVENDFVVAFRHESYPGRVFLFGFPVPDQESAQHETDETWVSMVMANLEEAVDARGARFPPDATTDRGAGGGARSGIRRITVRGDDIER